MLTILSNLNSLFSQQIVLFITANFILLIVFIAACFSNIKAFYAHIQKKTWLILGGIVLGSLLFRISLPIYYHIIFTDEHLYMQAAKNIVLTGLQGEYQKSIGWPFMLNLFFRLFGVNNWVALYACACLGVVTIVIMFLFVYVLLNNEKTALIAALLFSFMPLHIRWSATAETNTASLFFVMLSVLCCFFYYKRQTVGLLWLALMSIAFSAQFRPENYIFYLIFLIGVMIFCPHQIKITNIKFVTPFILSLFLSSANLWQVLTFQLPVNWINSDTQGAMTGSNWSLHNLFYNLTHYLIFVPPEGLHGPMIIITTVSLLVICWGIFLLFKHRRKNCQFLLIWWVILGLIYFSSWFQTMARSRFYMSFYPITIVFFTYGFINLYHVFVTKMSTYLPVKRIKLAILIGICGFGLLWMGTLHWEFSKVNHQAKRFMLETKIPELAEQELPADCLVLAVLPEVLAATTNFRVMQLNKFLNMPQSKQKGIINKQQVLFFEDFCALFYLNPKFKKLISRLNEKFFLKNLKDYSLDEVKYSFYEVGFK